MDHRSADIALEQPRTGFSETLLWRALLAVATLGTAVAIGLTQSPAPGYLQDAELAGLVRTMGALKLAAVFPFVMGAAWLRMDAPILPRLVYMGLAISAAVGIALILTLSNVMAGAVLFHLGFLGMIVHVARDSGFVSKVFALVKIPGRR